MSQPNALIATLGGKRDVIAPDTSRAIGLLRAPYPDSLWLYYKQYMPQLPCDMGEIPASFKKAIFKPLAGAPSDRSGTNGDGQKTFGDTSYLRYLSFDNNHIWNDPLNPQLDEGLGELRERIFSVLNPNMTRTSITITRRIFGIGKDVFTGYKPHSDVPICRNFHQHRVSVIGTFAEDDNVNPNTLFGRMDALSKIAVDGRPKPLFESEEELQSLEAPFQYVEPNHEMEFNATCQQAGRDRLTLCATSTPHRGICAADLLPAQPEPGTPLVTVHAFTWRWG